MASLDINFDEDFIKQIGNLRQIDIVAPKMINESLPIVDKEIRKQLNRVLSTMRDKKKRRSYGTLAKSIKINPCGNLKKMVGSALLHLRELITEIKRGEVKKVRKQAKAVVKLHRSETQKKPYILNTEEQGKSQLHLSLPLLPLLKMK